MTPRQEPLRDGKGRYQRTPDAVQRDADAAQLRAQGRTYQQIADELGYPDKGEAWRGVQRALQAIVKEPAEQLRALELTRLDSLYESAMSVLERQHLTVSHGKVVTHDGAPIPDSGPILAAIDRLLRIQERRAKLTGLDAPSRSRVSVDAEQLGAEILELVTRTMPDDGEA